MVAHAKAAAKKCSKYCPETAIFKLAGTLNFLNYFFQYMYSNVLKKAKKKFLLRFHYFAFFFVDNKFLSKNVKAAKKMNCIKILDQHKWSTTSGFFLGVFPIEFSSTFS